MVLTKLKNLKVSLHAFVLIEMQSFVLFWPHDGYYKTAFTGSVDSNQSNANCFSCYIQFASLAVCFLSLVFIEHQPLTH